MPQSAFSGPAPRDFYNRPDTDLKPRMDFDRVFNVAVVGDRVYFGSSAEDAIYCLDIRTGKTVWVYVTEGPVRLAPTCHKGRVYAGSDDGHVYCLSAKAGNLIWEKRIADRNYRLPSDGKFISLWPVRSGVIVEGGIAYCAAGFLPSESAFLAALDAETGEVGKPGTWRHARSGELSLQGFMLASDDRLYVPAGRSPPYVIGRASGKVQGQISGGGGTYCILDDRQQLIYGPSRYGGLELSDADVRKTMVTFEANHMIVAGDTSYLQTDTHLRAIDRHSYHEQSVRKRKAESQRKAAYYELKKLGKDQSSTKAKRLLAEMEKAKEETVDATKRLRATLKWQANCDHPHAMIKAGEFLYTGGNGKVAAFAASNGKQVWESAVSGNAFGLAVANGVLFVSTDNGRIHAFRQ
ncbi:MAG: PQQ-binding-like beta-propeller repeat protein [Limisphaerales bacterium]